MRYQVLEMNISIYIHDDIILVVYIDDILIAGPFIQACNAIAVDLSRKLEVVNKDEVKSFLDLNVVRNYEKHAIAISQSDYIDRLFAKFNMMNVKSISILFEIDTKLKLAMINDTFCNVKLYQKLINSLNHLTIFTRSDIIFAISKLSKYNSNPTITYFKANLHVLRYLKTTCNYYIIYKKSINISIFDIIDYFDSDFANDKNDRKSYTSYIFLINDDIII